MRKTLNYSERIFWVCRHDNPQHTLRNDKGAYVTDCPMHLVYNKDFTETMMRCDTVNELTNAIYNFFNIQEEFKFWCDYLRWGKGLRYGDIFDD